MARLPSDPIKANAGNEVVPKTNTYFSTNLVFTNAGRFFSSALKLQHVCPISLQHIRFLAMKEQAGRRSKQTISCIKFK